MSASLNTSSTRNLRNALRLQLSHLIIVPVYDLPMASAISHPEPLTRIVSVEVPNLDNPIVAAEYRRQREIVNASYEKQREELAFWESVQCHEGWE